MEFVKQVRKTEKGGLYAFYVVLEKGSKAGKIPYYCYANDLNEGDQIIDFVDGKMVSIYGQELAKRIIESRIKDLIKGKDNFDEIVRILTSDAKENNARFLR